MTGHYADAPRWAKVTLGVAALVAALVLAYLLPSIVSAFYLLWGAS